MSFHFTREIKPDMFLFTTVSILMTLIFCVIWYSLGYRQGAADEQTKALCRLYASQDHGGEIGKERLEKMGYLWQNFDYYSSCLKNSGK